MQGCKTVLYIYYEYIDVDIYVNYVCMYTKIFKIDQSNVNQSNNIYKVLWGISQRVLELFSTMLVYF